MDLALDLEKANQLQCGTCSVSMQALRNCSGKGTPAKIPLNDRIYDRCPRAISLESFEARYLVDLYGECRENKMLPAPGSINQQTTFTKELFDFLDNLVHAYRQKQHNKNMAEMKKSKK